MKLNKLQTDSGGEYLSENFTTHLSRHVTVCSLTIHDTPEENGVSECLNHMLLEHVCAMLLASDVLKFLWTEAVHPVIWIKKCMATHALDGKTPYEMVYNTKSDLEGLPEWGPCVFVLHEGHEKLKE